MINLQAAVFAKLSNDLNVPVYDAVPQPEDGGDIAEFPYVTIGEDTFTPFDTDNSIGYDATLTIHTWSRQRGRKETKEIQQEIYNALHRQTLTVAGFHFINLAFEFADTFVDSDGLTRHGVQRFRCIIEAT